MGCLILAILILLTLTPWAEPNSANTPSPVTFVQLTDAHIFDDSRLPATPGAFRIAADDREALAWSIDEINNLVGKGQPIDFVVFTGDLGLQNVEIPEGCKAAVVEFERGLPPVRFDSAVRELANELNRLAVKEIYFVPGNNDLVDEKITDLPRYTCFIKELNKQLGSVPNPTKVTVLEAQNPFLLGGVNFVGLNSATFRSPTKYKEACSNGTTDASIKQACPQEQLASLHPLVGPTAKAPLIVFTHIPDLKDPNNSQPAWRFSDDLRKQWEDEACQRNVIGIFAGHFHDWRRIYYGSTSGAQLLTVNPCVAKKTWVAPPLAAKFQEDKVPQARGLLLVTASPTGVSQAEVHWFDRGNPVPPRTCPKGHCLAISSASSVQRDWLYVGATLVTAVATFILAIIALIQAKAAKLAAGAADKNAQAVINSERAWVISIPIERKPELIFIPHSGTLTDMQVRNVFAASIVNSGRTPAKILRSTLIYVRIPTLDELPIEPEYVDIITHAGLILISGGEPFGHVAFLRPSAILTQSQAQSIMNKDAFLYAYGFVEYRCVFDCSACPHESRFGYVYNFPQGGEPQVLRGFIPAGPKAYNRYT